jgi:hypothetical protein
MNWLDMLTDPKRAGLMVLIAVGAIVVGKVVYNIWPKAQNPTFWGSVVAILLVGALAYLGIPEAAVVVWVFIGIAILMGVLALVLG